MPTPTPTPTPTPAPTPAPLPEDVRFAVEFVLEMELVNLSPVATPGDENGTTLDVDKFDLGLATYLNISADAVSVNGTELQGQTTLVMGAVKGYLSEAEAAGDARLLSDKEASAGVAQALLEAGVALKSLSVDAVDVASYELPAPGGGDGKGGKKKHGHAALIAVLVLLFGGLALGFVFRERLPEQVRERLGISGRMGGVNEPLLTSSV